MNDQITKETPKLRPITFLAGACLVLLCFLVFDVTIIAGYKENEFRKSSTSTPTTFPTPHILVQEPADKSNAIYEDFSSNKNDWGLYYPYGKLQIINGKLILQSNPDYPFTIGISNKFNPRRPKYYLQADFSTDTDSRSSFGLIFAISKSVNTFYLFEVWPRSASFHLMKFDSANWDELIPHSKAELRPYPQPNMLGVHFDNGNIQLYINGDLVSTFSDINPLQSKDVGIFTSTSGYRLIVDNFFIYYEK